MKKLRKIDGYCAPFALKYLSGFADGVVYEVCKMNWFQQKNGMEEYEFLKAAKDLCIKLRRVNLKKRNLYRCKLSAFLEAFPKGQYLVYTNCHVFVVDDQKIVDPLRYNLGLNRLVTGAWKKL